MPHGPRFCTDLPASGPVESKTVCHRIGGSRRSAIGGAMTIVTRVFSGRRYGMKSRYLLSAGAALAVAFGCADANAQFAWLGGPYPITYYVGPEGGWTKLTDQTDKITTAPFRADVGPVGF